MKKKLILFFACLWVVISFLIIQSTYAKYLSSIGSNANVGLASWKITLNTQDIMQNSNFSQNLTLTFPGDQYSIPDYIVPGSLRILRFSC